MKNEEIAVEETVQTGQVITSLLEEEIAEPEKQRSGEFYELARNEEGWHWCLWAKNGRIIARNAIPYASKQQALNAVTIAMRSGKGETKIVTAG